LYPLHPIATLHPLVKGNIMFKQLLGRMKELYEFSPCPCIRCGKPLPYYHHDDHICQICLEKDTDKVLSDSLAYVLGYVDAHKN